MQQAAQSGWYVSRKGQTFGPYSWDQIAQHASAGRIGRADKVLDPRTGAWTKPTQVAGLFGPGGAAAAPAGMSAAARVAVGIVLALAVGLGLATSLWVLAGGGPQWIGNEMQRLFGQTTQSTKANTSAQSTDAIPPEGLVYKGTFAWKSSEGVGLKDLEHDDQAYLWIYTTDDGTAASVNWGEHYIDGYPVFLVSQSGTQYTFESSTESLVERVRVVANVTEGSATATVIKIIDPQDREIGNFVGGTFSGSASTYEQYKADVID